MADIRIGAQIFEGVEKVKLDTADGGTMTFEKPTDLTAIAEALEAAGIPIEAADTDGIASAVAVIEDMLNPWEHLPNSGTDLLGDYTEVTATNTPNIARSAGYIRLKEHYNTGNLIFPETAYGSSVDLSNFKNNTYTFRSADNGKYTVTGRICVNNGASRIILPKEYPTYEVPNNQGAIAVQDYVLCSTAPVSVYLSQKMGSPQATLRSTWIGSQNSNSSLTEQIVKCPKDTEIPYFLNKMHKLTVDSMVGLFENLVDRADETSVATLTLGSENLARLTEDEKNIAYAKGWALA